MKKIVLPLIILAVAILIFIGLKATAPEVPVVEKPTKKWLVDTVTASYESIAPQVTLYGRIETPQDAVLKSALAADVAEVLVYEGQYVNAGELLIRLDDTDAQLIVQQRQADLADIEAQIQSEKNRYQRDLGLLKHQKDLLELRDRAVERASKLEQSKLASQANLDDAKAVKQQQLITLAQLQHDINEHPVSLAQLEAAQLRAQALLQQAQVDLDRTLIRAPFSGRIASRAVAIGDRVRAGDELIRIYDVEHLEVRAQIPGRYIRNVKKIMDSQQQLMASASVDGQDLAFSLNRLSGEVRTDSGGVDGLFALQNNVENLALGTFVELQLNLETLDNVLILPFAALYGLDRVYRIDDGHLQGVKIQRQGEIMRDGKRWLLVTSAEIKAGDQIVTTQLPNAITGLPVEASK